MTSYRTEAVRPVRDGLSSRIPHGRQQDWTELPGWVTVWVREKTAIGKKDVENAQVYDVLCKVWKVPEAFGVAREDGRVFVVSEGAGQRPSTPALLQAQNLARDIVNVLEFLARNAAATPRPLAWSHPHLARHFSQAEPDDWIVFPALDMLHWLANASASKAAEKSLRHLPSPRPCRLAVFGNFSPSPPALSVASMRFSQIWHRGFFVTVTSTAAASNPEGLRKLVAKMVERQYDDLEDAGAEPIEVVLWLSVQTYWLLGPPMASEEEGSEGVKMASMMAFTQLHHPDLPHVPVLAEDRLERGIRSLAKLIHGAIHLANAPQILDHLRIPRHQLQPYLQPLPRSFSRSDPSAQEILAISNLASRLVKAFWNFRLAFVLVDSSELPLVRNDPSPWCQYVTFDTFFGFLDRNFSD